MKQDTKGPEICPQELVQRILSGKWTLLILFFLREGTLRFGEIQKKIPDVTQATITKQLRSLEASGLVARKVYPQVPPKVEYCLTPIGEEFRAVLDSMELWGEKYKRYLDTRNEDENG